MSAFNPEKFLVTTWKCGGKEFFTFVIKSEDWPAGMLSPDVEAALIRYLRPDRKLAHCALFIGKSTVNDSMFIMELTKYVVA